MNERSLKYAIMALFAIAVVFPLVNLFYVFPGFERMSIELIEDNAASLARYASGSMVADGALAGSGKLEAQAEALRKSMDAHKVRVYSSDGTIVYSSVTGEIGIVHEGGDAWDALVKGNPYSELKRKGESSLEGEVAAGDLLETYVPIMASGEMVGFLEIYENVTREFGMIKSAYLKNMVGLLLISALALVLLFVLMLRTRSNDHDANTVGLSRLRVRYPYFQLAVMATSIFLAEFVVMLFLSVFPPMSMIGNAVFDALWLLLLTAPPLFFFLFKPLSYMVSELEATGVALREMVEEKEALRKEVVTRVQNNLGMVSSMLSLQVRRLKSQEARDAVMASEGRIRSMSIVYEMLYQSPEYPHVNARRFFNSLAVRIMRGLDVDANRVRLVMDIDDITLWPGAMVDCGIILNELLSNCARHAFGEEGSGEVRISLNKTVSNGAIVYEFKATDNGVGFSEGFDIERDGGHGLMIIRALAAQLGGTLKCECDGGATVRMIFTDRD